jgi:hypothetical protein
MVPPMNIALKLIAWLVGVAMALWLLIGLTSLWGAINLSRSSPSDMGDLAWVSVKIQKVTPKTTSTLLKAEGYPTIFTVASSAGGQPISSLVKPGDQVSVRVKKEIAGRLQDVSMSYVYGLQLSDGKKLLEDAKPIPTPFAMQFSDFAKLIGVPVVFFALVLGRKIWFQTKAGRQHTRGYRT